MSRVKDIHFYLQSSEVPYCSIDVFSDNPTSNHIDTFLFSQDCNDAIGKIAGRSVIFLDTSISIQELTNLRQSLSMAYSSIKSNQQLVFFLSS